jgi:SP family general alpha glucoside:H+ symporter-like MFS transporter
MLFMGVIGTLARQNGGELSSISPNAIVALACIWVAAYSMSAGPLGKSLLFDHGYNALTILSGWAYVADTVTPVLRAKTTSFAAALTCCFGLIFNYTTPIMLSPQQANWGIEIGYFFAGLSALGLVLIYFTVPEVSSLRRDVSPKVTVPQTRRLSFAELDELFEAKISARKFKSTHAQLRRAEQAAGYV